MAVYSTACPTKNLKNIGLLSGRVTLNRRLCQCPAFRAVENGIVNEYSDTQHSAGAQLGLWLIRIVELQAFTQDIRDLCGVGISFARFGLIRLFPCGIPFTHSVRVFLNV